MGWARECVGECPSRFVTGGEFDCGRIHCVELLVVWCHLVRGLEDLGGCWGRSLETVQLIELF